MTPQERQLVDDLFTRLASVENTPRDPVAAAVIADGQRRAPNALYTLVQTVLVQDEALKRANDRIQQLEGGGADNQAASGGFLDQMRDTLFGKTPQRGSVPNVQPSPTPASRPAWNTGEALQQTDQPGRYNQGPAGQPPAGQPYGTQPQAGGGSFLGTAAAAAAGAVGGGLLLNSIRSMMGGEAHASGFGNSNELRSPWGGAGDQSGSNLARDAGVKDVGSQHGNTSQNSSFDQAQADADQDQDQDQDDDDNDEMDMDSDDFDDGDDS
jgi:hypothetical protein